MRSELNRRGHIRPPVKWHGGKHYLCHRIIAHFPPHQTYVEPFGGCASVLLNKKAALVEVYNDMDSRITRLFRVLRERGDELRKLLSLTPYSEVEFDECGSKDGDELEQARRDFVRWRQSIGGRGDNFSYTLHRVRRGMADVVSGYLSSIDEQMPLIIDRLRTVQVLQRPAIGIISTWDSGETLFYCDPPYVPESRAEGSREVYGVEMSVADHKKFLQSALCCKGMMSISGYSSELYEDMLKAWKREVIEIPNHASGGKKKRLMQEVLWMNWK